MIKKTILLENKAYLHVKQVTPFEDLKAFFEFIKLKVGKNEVKRKERYLTIERSKSL